MKVHSNAFSKSLFLFGTVFSSITIIGTESLTPIKYNINSNINRIQTSTIRKATSSSSSNSNSASSSSIMEQEQQEEAKRICPFLSPPEDPTTTFEAAMG